MTKRIGVLGGTFNPIHFGHLRSAEEVCEQFRLDRIFFVPAAIPPHKSEVALPPGAKRMRMVKLAIEGNSRFMPSTVELSRGGRSYSVDTLKYFRRRFPPPHEIYFIVGMDAFLEIQSWKNYTEIPTLSNIVVTSRPGYPSRLHLKSMPIEFRSKFCYDSMQCMYVHASGTTIHFLRITPMGISASAIRRKLEQGESVRYLTTAAVIQYIEEQNLYRTTKGPGWLG